MVLWIAVAAGGLFAWMAVRIGFFASWIMFFNLLLAAYMGIFLGPVIIASVPATTDSPYGHALVLLSTATAALLVGYAACYACLAGRIRIEFPRVFDSLAAGVLGFLSGFLVWGFVSMSICLTPLPEEDFCRHLGFDSQSQKTNTAFVCWWCDRLHAFVSSSEVEVTSAETVELLQEEARPRAADSSNPSAAATGATDPAASEAGATKSSAPAKQPPSSSSDDDQPFSSTEDARGATGAP